MTATGSKSPGTAKHLIETMTGSDALPVFVQRIDPHTLKSLVDEVGLEDSGALIAHASQTQLVHLLDETLWTGAKPGDPDKLSVAELLRWLDVMNGVSPRFAADKLFELGDDFCALAFSRLLVVADSDLAARVLDEHTQALGTFLVRTRVDDEWDTVQTSINALWADYPDFTEAVLGRLSFRHSVLAMSDDQARVLDADAGYAHEQGREEAGYVTSISAGSFLKRLIDADVDELTAETEYDLQTQEYFRRRRQLQRFAAERAAEKEARKDTEAAVDGEDPEAEEVELAAGKVEANEAELRVLEAELEAFERAQHQPTALLTGPDTGVVQEADWIRLALGELQDAPEVFDARMDELTYLANLLMVGTEAGGERMESKVAARLALSACNLGASHELWLGGEGEPVAAVREMLSAEPGLVRLFRVGWHLLTALPGAAAERLKDLFQEEAVRDRLAEKPWVLEEADALLSNPDLEEVIRARDFEDARETLKILGIALEAEAVVVLCVLTDGVPRFARVLEERPPEGAVMTYASRDIATMGDLMGIHRFLDRLETQVRL
jgi:hypothetical protein